jgi:cyclopropane fatty-acyl-phospholipid synthase-like methyltransferase
MGTVYFFREHNREYVKIGYSKNGYQERYANFSMYCPDGSYVVGTIITSTPKKLEKEIHNKYASRHKRGEYYTLTDSEVHAIIREYDKNIDYIATKLRHICESYNVTENIILEAIEDRVKYFRTNASQGVSIEKEILDKIELMLKELNKTKIEVALSDLYDFIGTGYDKATFRKVVNRLYMKGEPKYINCPLTGKSKTARPLIITALD